VGALQSILRLRYYDEWTSTGGLFSPGDASDQDNYGSEILVDLELGFDITENYRLSIGGENVFDTLPDDELNGTSRFLGVDSALTSPFGFNGGFWYARFSANF